MSVDVESRFQREEVEAAVRTTSYSDRPDPRGVAITTEAAALLVRELGDDVLEWRTFRDEITVVVAPANLLRALTLLRDRLDFRLLSNLSPVDWLDAVNPPRAAHGKRFSVSYVVTKLVPGAPRLTLQLFVDEGEDIPSAIGVYPSADWHEREAYDFFGLAFTGREPMRRLIMPDDWVGHPLRKDYPIGGEPAKFTNSPREI